MSGAYFAKLIMSVNGVEYDRQAVITGCPNNASLPFVQAALLVALWDGEHGLSSSVLDIVDEDDGEDETQFLEDELESFFLPFWSAENSFVSSDGALFSVISIEPMTDEQYLGFEKVKTLLGIEEYSFDVIGEMYGFLNKHGLNMQNFESCFGQHLNGKNNAIREVTGYMLDLIDSEVTHFDETCVEKCAEHVATTLV